MANQSQDNNRRPVPDDVTRKVSQGTFASDEIWEDNFLEDMGDIHASYARSDKTEKQNELLERLEKLGLSEKSAIGVCRIIEAVANCNRLVEDELVFIGNERPLLGKIDGLVDGLKVVEVLSALEHDYIGSQLFAEAKEARDSCNLLKMIFSDRSDRNKLLE